MRAVTQLFHTARYARCMDHVTSAAVSNDALRPLARLRPRGIGRFFSGAFLAVWLTGWAYGEVAALGLVGGGLAQLLDIVVGNTEGGSLFAGAGVTVFLSVWLAGWTVGGLTALRTLLGMFFGIEEIAAGATGVVVVSGLGPFRRQRHVRRDDIFGVELLPGRAAVVVELVGERWRVATLGTTEERTDLADALRVALGDGSTTVEVAQARTPPHTFSVHEQAGELRVMRSVRAWPLVVVALPLALFFGASFVSGVLQDAPDRAATAAPLALAAVALAVVGVRRREHGFVVQARTLRQRIGLVHVRERPLELPLTVHRNVDGDGDETFELRAGKRVLLRDSDAAPCLHLGRFLSQRLGSRLQINDSDVEPG
jgi:hypothetical protein